MPVTRLEPLACPSCAGVLAPARGRHGFVWICRRCRAGAATLPILRQVAPPGFVDDLWQAALHGGRVSTLACPSCGQRFTRLVGAGTTTRVRIEVCVGCFWVWLDPRAVAALGAGRPRPKLLTGRRPDAPTALATLAAGVIRDDDPSS